MGQLLSAFAPSKATREGSVADVAALLANARGVCVLTGAGVSKESGIPTFRDPADGIWRRYDPMSYATIYGYDRAPHLIWELMRDFLAETTPRPNPGHVALAELQSLGIVRALVTQNVDNLHQDAGSTGVIEFHGSLLTSACRECKAPGGPVPPLLAAGGPLPPRCGRCGGPLKPSAVLFGEAIPPDAASRAAAAASACDVMLVVGTSASVRPAADLPRLALAAGAVVIEVNTEATALTGRYSDVILRGKAGVVLPQVVEQVKRIRSGGGARVDAAMLGGGGGETGPRAALCAQPRGAHSRPRTAAARARARVRTATPAYPLA